MVDNDYVVSIIKRLIDREHQKNIYGENILDRAIYKEIIDDTNKCLNSLFKEKKIKVSKSLNDKIIKLIENE